MPLFVHLPWQRAEPVCFEMMASPYCDVPCGEVCLTRTAWRPGYVHIRRKSLVDGCCRDHWGSGRFGPPFPSGCFLGSHRRSLPLCTAGGKVYFRKGVLTAVVAQKNKTDVLPALKAE